MRVRERKGEEEQLPAGLELHRPRVSGNTGQRLIRRKPAFPMSFLKKKAKLPTQPQVAREYPQETAATV